MTFSAGCGRTGTYIVLDMCLKQVRNEDKVDVFECLRRVREQRSFMVETQVCILSTCSMAIKCEKEFIHLLLLLFVNRAMADHRKRYRYSSVIL